VNTALRAEAEGVYAVPLNGPLERGLPLSPPPHGATSLTYLDELVEVRAVVLRRALEAGLTDSRAGDLVLAVSEAAANTLRHTDGSGTLSIWDGESEIICEIRDQGIISDPRVGCSRPAPDAPGGHGLWLIRQVCDEVELHSWMGGTTLRMHMRT
jgi:anti-sigma regulatory factor (Ser/Thr protein kinase)